MPSDKTPSLRDLTAAERLFIARRRRDLTQAAFAKRHRVNLLTYRAWEADAVPDGVKKIPKVDVRPPLTPLETAIIMRRRAKFGRTEMAAKLGCSSCWVSRMESGSAPPDRLLEYWGLGDKKQAA